MRVSRQKCFFVVYLVFFGSMNFARCCCCCVNFKKFKCLHNHTLFTCTVLVWAFFPLLLRLHFKILILLLYLFTHLPPRKGIRVYLVVSFANKWVKKKKLYRFFHVLIRRHFVFLIFYCWEETLHIFFVRIFLLLLLFSELQIFI